MEFEKATELLRDGRTTYEQYALQTIDRWEATARWLMRRWRLPGWVEVGDITQELLVGAWRAVWRYEPGRGGMTIGGYVRVSAVNDAMKVVHHLRGVDLHTCKGPSRIDAPFSTLGEDAEGIIDTILSTPAEQEEAVDEERERSRVLGRCETLEELLVLQALAMARTFLGGAALMWSDQETREMLDLRSEEHAARLIVRASHQVAHRLGWRWDTTTQRWMQTAA